MFLLAEGGDVIKTQKQFDTFYPPPPDHYLIYNLSSGNTMLGLLKYVQKQQYPVADYEYISFYSLVQNPINSILIQIYMYIYIYVYSITDNTCF